MAIVFLILGSNLGDRESFIDTAKTKLIEEVGAVLQESRIYETEPWGFKHDNQFLNQVISLETFLEPQLLLNVIKGIEQDLGRVRDKKRYSARCIDIDILFYDQLVLSTPDLTIPHPEIQNRRFVLEPLGELVNDFIHPILKKSIKQLLENCLDAGIVKKVQKNQDGLFFTP